MVTRDKLIVAAGLICMEFAMPQWLRTTELHMSAGLGNAVMSNADKSGQWRVKTTYFCICPLWMAPN